MAGMFDGLDWELVREVERTEREHLAAKSKLSDAIMELVPFKKNDIVRDKDTGARYRVVGGSGYVNRGRPSMLLEGFRVYTTGRKEARSRSWLDSKNLEKVVD